jgi:hypothetical protein
MTNVIQRFAPDGTYLGVFASPSASPSYLESDRSGNVYTTTIEELPFPHTGSWLSFRFDSSGALTRTFFGGGRGIDADAAGNVYIAGNGILEKFAPNGTPLNTTMLGSISPQDLSIDEATNRLYLATDSDGIKIFDIAGAAPNLVGSIPTPANAAIFGVHYAAESGNILTTDLGLGSNDPRGLEYSPSGQLLHEYRPAGVELAWDITTFSAPEPTDYNRNGLWDAADYVVWRKGMPAADGNGNGVDDSDYLFWRRRFGQPGNLSGGALLMPAPNDAIPEPNSVALAAAALSLCIARCRRLV